MFHYLSFAHTCRARGSQHRQLFGQRRFWPPKKYRLGCWNHPNDTRHLWWAPALWCGHVSSFWRFVRHLQDNISGQFFLFRESRPQTGPMAGQRSPGHIAETTEPWWFCPFPSSFPVDCFHSECILLTEQFTSCSIHRHPRWARQKGLEIVWNLQKCNLVGGHVLAPQWRRCVPDGHSMRRSTVYVRSVSRHFLMPKTLSILIRYIRWRFVGKCTRFAFWGSWLVDWHHNEQHMLDDCVAWSAQVMYLMVKYSF